MMKIEEIKTIVKLMSEYELTEFRVEADGCICIKRESAPVVAEVLPAPVAVAAPAAVSPAAPAAPAAPVASAEARNTIDSPLVGTYYSSPSPDAAPFVSVGDRISADTVVCIIEAMKVMNEVKAEKGGVVKEILVQNGQPVEYGQPMFVLG